MADFNSILSATHAHVDKMLDKGIVPVDTLKVLNIAEVLRRIGEAYLPFLDPDIARSIAESNRHNDREVADELGFILDILIACVSQMNPLTNLTVDADIAPSVNLFGKTVIDLQDEISIGKNRTISGVLNYISNYTDYSDDITKQFGNYLALHISVAGVDNATITVKVDGEYVPVNQDGIAVIKVTKSTRRIIVSALKDGEHPVTKVYTLTGLKLLDSSNDYIILNGEPDDDGDIYDGFYSYNDNPDIYFDGGGAAGF